MIQKTTKLRTGWKFDVIVIAGKGRPRLDICRMTIRCQGTPDREIARAKALNHATTHLVNFVRFATARESQLLGPERFSILAPVKTTSQIFDQQARVSRLLQEVTAAAVKRADPATGGSLHLAHNWGNDQAREILNRHSRRQHFIYTLFNAAYKQAFYREYPEHLESIKHRKTA